MLTSVVPNLSYLTESGKYAWSLLTKLFWKEAYVASDKAHDIQYSMEGQISHSFNVYVTKKSTDRKLNFPSLTYFEGCDLFRMIQSQVHKRRVVSTIYQIFEDPSQVPSSLQDLDSTILSSTERLLQLAREELLSGICNWEVYGNSHYQRSYPHCVVILMQYSNRVEIKIGEDLFHLLPEDHWGALLPSIEFEHLALDIISIINKKTPGNPREMENSLRREFMRHLDREKQIKEGSQTRFEVPTYLPSKVRKSNQDES